MPSHLELLALESIANSNDEQESIAKALGDYVNQAKSISLHGLGFYPSKHGQASDDDSKPFSHIIIGTGMGGGLLARQLISNGHKVLVLEKGGSEFLTHCLNTSRPHFNVMSQDGPGRDNEVLFNKVLTKYKTVPTSVPKDDPSYCEGGSYFGLGGRSLFWSLEAPEIDERVASSYFPPQVVKSLWDRKESAEGTDIPGQYQATIISTEEGWYTKASRILTNSPPGAVINPFSGTKEAETAQYTLDKAVQNFITDTIVAVPQGAEFNDGTRPYYFSQGAYSTADWLVNHIYASPQPSKVLPGVEVLRFSLNNKGNKVDTLEIRDQKNGTHIHLDSSTKVILCAGTVNTAAIALRSGRGTDDDFNVDHPLTGQGLTDHEIWMARYWKRIGKGQLDEKPVELSCHVSIHGNPALLTVCIHAEKFYSHAFATGEADPEPLETDLVNVLNIMLEFEAPLNEKGRVIMRGEEPMLHINRSRLDASKQFDDELKKLIKSIRIGFDFLGEDKPQLSSWGAVAHEVGTMRMDGPTTKGVVDSNLKVHGVDNLYVCDLSVFPVSPMANPSKTLTALAMRLADHLA